MGDNILKPALSEFFDKWFVFFVENKGQNDMHVNINVMSYYFIKSS